MLDGPVAAGLFEYLIASEPEFVAATVIPPGASQGGIFHELRAGLALGDLGPFCPVVQAAVLDRLGEVMARLDQPPFEPTSVLMEASAATDGSFFALHTDDYRFRDRQLTAVLYVHATPRRFSGGELRVHPTGTDPGRHVTVAPRHNRMVAFRSRASHQVLPVRVSSCRFRDSRFAVTVWVHG